jgi:hypothetical protein
MRQLSLAQLVRINQIFGLCPVRPTLWWAPPRSTVGTHYRLWPV